MKSIIEILSNQSEVEFSKGKEILFVRVYSDGKVKVENENVLIFFDNIEKASAYLIDNEFTNF